MEALLARLSHVEKIIISKGLRRAFHPQGQYGRQDRTKDILPSEHTTKAIHLKKALDQKQGLKTPQGPSVSAPRSPFPGLSRAEPQTETPISNATQNR